MVINEKLYYTYHILDQDEKVVERHTHTDRQKLINLINSICEDRPDYTAVYVGRQYHAIHWQQTDPEAQDFLIQLRDAQRVYTYHC